MGRSSDEVRKLIHDTAEQNYALKKYMASHNHGCSWQPFSVAPLSELSSVLVSFETSFYPGQEKGRLLVDKSKIEINDETPFQSPNNLGMILFENIGPFIEKITASDEIISNVTTLAAPVPGDNHDELYWQIYTGELTGPHGETITVLVLTFIANSSFASVIKELYTTYQLPNLDKYDTPMTCFLKIFTIYRG
jgi:hypothetical protein